jgi:hypothetical protein
MPIAIKTDTSPGQTQEIENLKRDVRALARIAQTSDDVASAISSTPSGISDAPSDGNTYGRNNGAWTVISAGSVSATEYEVDFGLKPVYSKSFTIIDASVGVGSKIMITACGKAPTGLTADEWEFDMIQWAAEPGSGSFTLRAIALPGPVSGKRKINYILG